MTIPVEWNAFLSEPEPLAPGKNFHVFLSYRSINRGWVLTLYDVLTSLGFKVFLDQYQLTPGDSLVGVLQRGLTGSQAGILIWSNAAGDSKWVEREYDVMITRSTNDPSFLFIPIRIDRTPLPAFAATELFLDFTDYPDGPNGGDLLRLIYKLQRRSLTADLVKFIYQQDEAAIIANATITAATKNDMPQRLIELYNYGGLPWKTSASLPCKAANGLISLGHKEAAINMLTAIVNDFPKAVRPKQLKALALARRGQGDDLENAQEILGELHALGQTDPETLGIYARTWMDKHRISGDRSDLRQSRDLYLESFLRWPDDYYTGINAASKSIFLGEDIIGKEYAQKVKDLLNTKPVMNDYWEVASLAEAELILGDYTRAATFYQMAVDLASKQKDSLNSTFHQAKSLLVKMAVPEEITNLVLMPFIKTP